MTRQLHSDNGARFVSADDMIVAHILRTGEAFEPATTRFMFAALSGGLPQCFVDVGASTGWFSIPIAMAGHKVIAFEPNRRVRERFRLNAEINGVEIDLRGKALSAAAGVTTFWHNPRVPLTSGGSIERATCNGAAAETVEMVPLDKEVDVSVDGPVRLIKVDVEGHELSVLEGARKTLKRCRPHLVLEGNTEAQRQGLRDWLDAFGGYRCRVADGRNLLCEPEDV